VKLDHIPACDCHLGLGGVPPLGRVCAGLFSTDAITFYLWLTQRLLVNIYFHTTQLFTIRPLYPQSPISKLLKISKSIDSTNYRSKIFGQNTSGRNCEDFLVISPQMMQCNNSLCRKCLALGIIERWFNLMRGLHGLYANIWPIYVRGLSILRCWYPWRGIRFEPIPMDEMGVELDGLGFLTDT
jgi:hypothetical protein